MLFKFLIVFSIFSSSLFAADWEEIKTSRELRVLVYYGPSEYFIVKGKPAGPIAAYIDKLKIFLNNRNKKEGGKLPISIKVIPKAIDENGDMLNKGKIDLLMSMQVTPNHLPENETTTKPVYSDGAELIVNTSKHKIKSIDDLSGKEIFVRERSHGFETLESYNKILAEKGLPEIKIMLLDSRLSNFDILEMVNAKLIPATITRKFFAEGFKSIFKDIVSHDEHLLTEHQIVAWRLNKNDTKLLSILNEFIDQYKEKTIFGNIIKKQFSSIKKLKNAVSQAEFKKFKIYIDLFKKYGNEYKVDYLLLAAQGYQESRLNHEVRSRAGAIGVMQILPATGRSLHVGNIRNVDPNIHAGAKYLIQLKNNIKNNSEIDDENIIYFALASYNAGPKKIQDMQEIAKSKGLNPNIWFNNVERVTLEHVGWEPVRYITNIYQYYSAYKVAEITHQKKY